MYTACLSITGIGVALVYVSVQQIAYISGLGQDESPVSPADSGRLLSFPFLLLVSTPLIHPFPSINLLRCSVHQSERALTIHYPLGSRGTTQHTTPPRSTPG
jgi:hypothetical protein